MRRQTIRKRERETAALFQCHPQNVIHQAAAAVTDFRLSLKLAAGFREAVVLNDSARKIKSDGSLKCCREMMGNDSISCLQDSSKRSNFHSAKMYLLLPAHYLLCNLQNYSYVTIIELGSGWICGWMKRRKEGKEKKQTLRENKTEYEALQILCNLYSVENTSKKRYLLFKLMNFLEVFSANFHSF